MTIRGLQRLLMILGGKVAVEFRKIIEGTFTRVMAGDQSLIEVINANAASQEPMQQAYRQALAQEPVAVPLSDDMCLKKKRRREEILSEIEIAKLEFDLVEIQRKAEDGRLAIEERRLSHRYNLLQYTNTAVVSINALKDLANVDEHTKTQAQDRIRDLLFNESKAQVSSEGGGGIQLANDKEEPKIKYQHYNYTLSIKKVSSFMFAFTGTTIRRNVMQDKIRSVEVGVLEGPVKYCRMCMFDVKGRQESSMLNIVKEYNALVSDSDYISVIALYGLPIFIPENKCRGNFLELKLQKDRLEKPAGFESWKNAELESVFKHSNNNNLKPPQWLPRSRT